MEWTIRWYFSIDVKHEWWLRTVSVSATTIVKRRSSFVGRDEMFKAALVPLCITRSKRRSDKIIFCDQIAKQYWVTGDMNAFIKPGLERAECEIANALFSW